MKTAESPQDVRIAELAKALAHPARLRILRVLLAAPGCNCGDIVEQVGLAQFTVSEHLRILKVTGVISGEIDGPRVCYAFSPDTLHPLTDFIAVLTPPHNDACCQPATKEPA